MLSSVSPAPLPDEALLQRFVDSGDYTDCFVCSLEGAVTLGAYVEAFYTTSVFKAERLILKWLVSRPSTDEEAGQIARGETQAFAAWKTLERTDDQLLLMDFRGQTCSWFKVEPESGSSRLYFGSAVMRSQATPAGRKMPRGYRLLMGFHRLYSRVLLAAARSGLRRSNASGG